MERNSFHISLLSSTPAKPFCYSLVSQWEYRAAGCRGISSPLCPLLIEALLSDSTEREKGWRERQRIVRKWFEDTHVIGKRLLAS